MKKSIVFIITLSLSIVSVVSAQTNVDQQRERDIKIAEGILSELFGDEDSGNIKFPGFQDRSVQGEYIPGFGVHFTVSPGLTGFVIREFAEDGEEIRVDVRGSGSPETGSNTEEAEQRTYEYMTRYAALISGIPDDETIRVTYAPGNNQSFNWVVIGNGNQTQATARGVSVWAGMGDLKAFREGNLSEQELMNRINSYTMDEDETYKDFNVFATVLETSLNSIELEHLRITRTPQMEYLPGLGVRYRVRVSASPGILFNKIEIFDDNFEFRMDSIRLNLEESLQLMEESLNPIILKMDSMIDFDLTEEEREQMQREMKEQQQIIRIRQDSLRRSLKPMGDEALMNSSDDVDLTPEFEAIITEIVDVIQNYGSTLTSLENEEMLMITLNWNSRQEELPERTEIRIRKSDLLNGAEPEIEDIERR